MANQILFILCIFNKPNVWYLWSLGILAFKIWFLFNFAKLLDCCHFVVGKTKNFKLWTVFFLLVASKKLYSWVRNGHSTTNRRLFNVDITLIHREPQVEDIKLFPHRGYQVVSTYFFWHNFDVRKIHVVSTYFPWNNLAGRKIRIILACFFDLFFWSEYRVSTFFHVLFSMYLRW